MPLLFLHGVGSDRTAWNRQLERFGQDRLAIAIDMPGYGDSGAEAGGDLAGFAACAIAVLDALDIAQVHLCGLSLGGVVAIALAQSAPERVASLILADTFACHPEGQAILERSLAGLAEHGMAGLAERRADALLAQPADVAVRQEVIETMRRIDPEAYRRAAAIVWLADQRREVTSLDQPTLILYGSEDRITPPSLSEELKTLMPHAGLIEVAGAGHLPNIEQPAVFNRVVAAFLSDVERIS